MVGAITGWLNNPTFWFALAVAVVIVQLKPWRWSFKKHELPAAAPSPPARRIKVSFTRHAKLAMYRRGMAGTEKYANADEGVPAEMKQWHTHAVSNSEEIAASRECGCFQCGSIYAASEITEWMWEPDGSSAMCAECGGDTVIGDASGAPLNEAFLQNMNEWWL